MAKRCRVCGAWCATHADRMPPPEHLTRLYPILGYLADAAAEYDRDSLRVVSGEMQLTSAVEFVAWLDFEVRSATGITHGRSYGAGSPSAVLRAKDLVG